MLLEELKEEFKEDFKKAMYWLATESEFIHRILNDLQKLKQDLMKAKRYKSKRRINRALKDYWYAGKVEKRFLLYEREIEKILANFRIHSELQFKRSISDEELMQLWGHIHFAIERTLLGIRSREGHIKDGLLKIQSKLKESETSLKKTLALGFGTAIQDEIDLIIDDVEALTGLIDSIKSDLNKLELDVGPLIG